MENCEHNIFDKKGFSRFMFYDVSSSRIEEQLLTIFLYLRQQTQAKIDLFSTCENLTTDIEDSSLERYCFTSYLCKSTRSSNFIHGSDMLPGLYSGIQGYLSTHGKQLATLKKMRFQEPVSGDLRYTLTNAENKSLQRSAHVWGSFSDTNGELYRFYGRDKSQFIIRPYKTENPLYQALLMDPSDKGKVAFVEATMEGSYPLTIPLQDVSHKEYIGDYQEIMETDQGFFWATLIDIATKVFQHKTRSTGVMINYENLHLGPHFSLDKFLDGSCTLRISPLELNRPMNTVGFGNKLQFEVIHDAEVIAGGTFVTSRRKRISEI